MKFLLLIFLSTETWDKDNQNSNETNVGVDIGDGFIVNVDICVEIDIGVCTLGAEADFTFISLRKYADSLHCIAECKSKCSKRLLTNWIG